MGYEVLDGRTPDGQREPLDELTPGHVDVVDLADLPDPTPGAVEGDRGGLAQRSARVWSGRPVPGKVVIAVALVAGLLLGGWVGRVGRPTTPSAAGHLAVLATTTGGASVVTTDAGTGTARGRYELRLLNLGAADVSVVTRPTAAGEPRPGEAVALIPTRPSIGPGEQGSVTIEVAVDCQDPTDFVPRVQVASADGSQADVVVRDEQLSDFHVHADQLCSATPDGEHTFDSALDGSVTAPVLVLTNLTDRPLKVAVSNDSSIRPRPGQLVADPNSGELTPALVESESGLGARLTTTPALPLLLAPHTTKRLAVRLSVRVCLPQSALSGAGGLGLAGLPAGSGSSREWTATYLDLGPALGAKVARVCQQQEGR